MKQSIMFFICVFLGVLLAGCSQKDNPTGPGSSNLIPNDELPWASAICATPNAIIATGLIGGSGVYIFRSTDNGSNWVVVDTIEVNTHPPNTFLFVIPSTTLFVHGTDVFAGISALSGGVYVSTDGGRNWEESDSNFTENVNCFAAINGRIFAATDSGVFSSTNMGLSWSATGKLPSRIVVRLATDGNTLFAGAGGIFISNDDGATWNEADSGVTNRDIVALAASGSEIIAGTFQYPNYPPESTGGIFISEDMGAHWILSNSGLTNDDIGALYSYNSELFAGTDQGLFLSTDSGQTWTDVSAGTQADSTSISWIAPLGSSVFVVAGSGPQASIIRVPL